MDSLTAFVTDKTIVFDYNTAIAESVSVGTKKQVIEKTELQHLLVDSNTAVIAISPNLESSTNRSRLTFGPKSLTKIKDSETVINPFVRLQKLCQEDIDLAISKGHRSVNNLISYVENHNQDSAAEEKASDRYVSNVFRNHLINKARGVMEVKNNKEETVKPTDDEKASGRADKLSSLIAMVSNRVKPAEENIFDSIDAEDEYDESNDSGEDEISDDDDDDNDDDDNPQDNLSCESEDERVRTVVDKVSLIHATIVDKSHTMVEDTGNSVNSDLMKFNGKLVLAKRESVEDNGEKTLIDIGSTRVEEEKYLMCLVGFKKALTESIEKDKAKDKEQSILEESTAPSLMKDGAEEGEDLEISPEDKVRELLQSKRRLSNTKSNATNLIEATDKEALADFKLFKSNEKEVDHIHSVFESNALDVCLEEMKAMRDRTETVNANGHEYDIDEIDGTVFKSFESTEFLLDYIMNTEDKEAIPISSNRASPSKRLFIGNLTSLKNKQFRYGIAGNVIKYFRKRGDVKSGIRKVGDYLQKGEEAQKVVEMETSDTVLNSPVRSPTKTNDITKIKGWRSKFPECDVFKDMEVDGDIGVFDQLGEFESIEQLDEFKDIKEFRRTNISTSDQANEDNALEAEENFPLRILLTQNVQDLGLHLKTQRGGIRRKSNINQNMTRPRPYPIIKKNNVASFEDDGNQPSKGWIYGRRIDGKFATKTAVSKIKSTGRKPVKRPVVQNQAKPQSKPIIYHKTRMIFRPTTVTKKLAVNALEALDSAFVKYNERIGDGQLSNEKPVDCDRPGCRYGCICQEKDAPSLQQHLEDYLPPLEDLSQLPSPPLPKVSGEEPECGHAYCRLGVICDSLSKSDSKAILDRGHCDKFDCIFGCVCKMKPEQLGRVLRSHLWQGEKSESNSRSSSPVTLEQYLTKKLSSNPQDNVKKLFEKTATDKNPPVKARGKKQIPEATRKCSRLKGHRSLAHLERPGNLYLYDTSIWDGEAFSTRPAKKSFKNTTTSKRESKELPEKAVGSRGRKINPKLTYMKPSDDTSYEIEYADEIPEHEITLDYELKRKFRAELDLDFDFEEEGTFSCARATVYIPARLKNKSKNCIGTKSKVQSLQVTKLTDIGKNARNQPIGVASKVLKKTDFHTPQTTNSCNIVIKEEPIDTKPEMDSSPIVSSLASLRNNSLPVITSIHSLHSNAGGVACNQTVKEEPKDEGVSDHNVSPPVKKVNVQMVMLQKKSKNKEKTLVLLEIKSDCDWSANRAPLLSKMSSALSKMGKRNTHKNIEVDGFVVTYDAVQSNKAVPIPRHMQNPLLIPGVTEMVPVRYTITKAEPDTEFISAEKTMPALSPAPPAVGLMQNKNLLSILNSSPSVSVPLPPPLKRKPDILQTDNERSMETLSGFNHFRISKGKLVQTGLGSYRAPEEKPNDYPSEAEKFAANLIATKPPLEVFKVKEPVPPAKKMMAKKSTTKAALRMMLNKSGPAAAVEQVSPPPTKNDHQPENDVVITINDDDDEHEADKLKSMQTGSDNDTFLSELPADQEGSQSGHNGEKSEVTHNSSVKSSTANSVDLQVSKQSSTQPLDKGLTTVSMSLVNGSIVSSLQDEPLEGSSARMIPIQSKTPSPTPTTSENIPTKTPCTKSFTQTIHSMMTPSGIRIPFILVPGKAGRRSISSSKVSAMSSSPIIKISSPTGVTSSMNVQPVTLSSSKSSTASKKKVAAMPILPKGLMVPVLLGNSKEVMMVPISSSGELSFKLPIHSMRTSSANVTGTSSSLIKNVMTTSVTPAVTNVTTQIQAARSSHQENREDVIVIPDSPERPLASDNSEGSPCPDLDFDPDSLLNPIIPKTEAITEPQNDDFSSNEIQSEHVTPVIIEPDKADDYEAIPQHIFPEIEKEICQILESEDLENSDPQLDLGPPRLHSPEPILIEPQANETSHEKSHISDMDCMPELEMCDVVKSEDDFDAGKNDLYEQLPIKESEVKVEDVQISYEMPSTSGLAAAPHPRETGSSLDMSDNSSQEPMYDINQDDDVDVDIMGDDSDLDDDDVPAAVLLRSLVESPKTASKRLASTALVRPPQKKKRKQQYNERAFNNMADYEDIQFEEIIPDYVDPNRPTTPEMHDECEGEKNLYKCKRERRRRHDMSYKFELLQQMLYPSSERMAKQVLLDAKKSQTERQRNKYTAITVDEETGVAHRIIAETTEDVEIQKPSPVKKKKIDYSSYAPSWAELESQRRKCSRSDTNQKHAVEKASSPLPIMTASQLLFAKMKETNKAPSKNTSTRLSEFKKQKLIAARSSTPFCNLAKASARSLLDQALSKAKNDLVQHKIIPLKSTILQDSQESPDDET